MFGIYTYFKLSSKYSYNKNYTTPYFINLKSNRVNFAVRDPTSLIGCPKFLTERYQGSVKRIIIYFFSLCIFDICFKFKVRFIYCMWHAIRYLTSKISAIPLAYGFVKYRKYINIRTILCLISKSMHRFAFSIYQLLKGINI